jgi:Tol biopolymer transport system component
MNILRPKFSPDGLKVLFLNQKESDNNPYDLMLLDLSKRKIRVLDSGNVNGEYFWSPNGSNIAYHKLVKDGSRIYGSGYISDSNGNFTRKIMDGGQIFNWFDNDTLMIADPEFNAIDLNGNKTNIEILKILFFAFPSPDLSLIAFANNPDTFLRIYDLKSRKIISVGTSDNVIPNLAAWSPDSKKLAYTNYRTKEIRIFDITNQEDKELFENTTEYVPRVLNWFPEEK